MKEAKYLNPVACRTPIYFLPKIHKSMMEQLGRPIIIGIELVCSKLSQYIDTFLQLLVVKAEAYIKDTKHVIQCLESLDELDECILATTVVGSLYTIIGHEEVLTSVEWALECSDRSGKT